MEMMYNNFMITNMINITEVRRPPMADRTANTLDVAGRNGLIFQNSFLGTRKIEVDFYIKYDHLPDTPNSDSEYRKVVKSLTYYLTGNTAPAKLIFSDDPNNYYLALVTGFDLSRLLRLGQGTITFECYTPYLHSLAEYVFNETNGILTIDNDGTASTYPRFETTLSTNATYITYVSTKGAIQVGNPNGIYTDGTEGTPLNPMAYSDTCANTSKWSVGSSSLLWSGRTIDSNAGMYSDGMGIRTNNSPVSEAGSKLYTGMFMMTELPRALEYWQTKLYFNFHSTDNSGYGTTHGDRMGMIEFYLFDENNNVLTNFSLRDYYDAYQHNVPQWYGGNKKLLWKEEGTVGSSNTVTYTEKVESLDEVPKGAIIIADTQVPKYRATINFNGTAIYSYPSMSAKVLTKGGKGNTYPVKETNASWTSIYMNSAKTTVGYVRTSGVSVSEDGTEISVVYKMPVDASSAGNWNNFAGCVILDRIANSVGGITWNMGLYQKQGTNAWGGKVTHKVNQTIQDTSGTAVSSAGKLKRIGVFIGSYNGATMPDFVRFDDLVVTEYVDEATLGGEEGEETPTYNYVGVAGDIITVDCGEQMVYKNNEPFMDYLDVGSEFFDIDAFTSSEVRVVSDDSSASTTAYITKRYL